ncbi:crotonase/enoyl-CoA hydratase family protein [Maritalea porphyrae]|uniref:crotonase/enoyl-CoA hydratase family protein n=1 Tax=Maritalea porphyrae TaxID=880732 RepID=UPI0022AF7829|nr:crotonase/enoyl-CoA hydratase family protein [Maritalea porphyrae]MCZ4271004.1 crotonase/enoyl-CoA hydratase family protein [Maritalea porphyrae]
MTKNLAVKNRSIGREEPTFKLLTQSDLPFNRPKDQERFWGNLGQIESNFDISNATVWSFMQFEGRASYNPRLLDDFHNWHINIEALKSQMHDQMKFVVLGSRHEEFFCLGGDLDYFSRCIEEQDREGLYEYGLSCVQILHRNWLATSLDLVTIALVQGDALGGGFESLLSFDIICAEKGAKFGFPEHLFGLFPGMGALTFLGRKLGFAKAEQLIRTGRSLSAEELFEMGVVQILAEPGEGVKAVKKYISKTTPRHQPACAYHAAIKRANPIPFEELDDIVSYWTDAALKITPRELKIMRRLVSAQSNKPLTD